MSAAKTPDCPVCEGVEPWTIDRLLSLGHGPRWIAPKFGHTRRAVARHRSRCFVGERRAAVEEDLRAMADTEGEGVRRG